VKRSRFTRWTPELRARLFNYGKMFTYLLNKEIEEQLETLRKIRLHPANKISLEDLNYRKNKIQAMRDEMERRKRVYGEEAVRKAISSKNDGEVLIIKRRSQR